MEGACQTSSVDDDTEAAEAGQRSARRPGSLRTVGEAAGGAARPERQSRGRWESGGGGLRGAQALWRARAPGPHRPPAPEPSPPGPAPSCTGASGRRREAPRSPQTLGELGGGGGPGASQQRRRGRGDAVGHRPGALLLVGLCAALVGAGQFWTNCSSRSS